MGSLIPNNMPEQNVPPEQGNFSMTPLSGGAMIPPGGEMGYSAGYGELSKYPGLVEQGNLPLTRNVIDEPTTFGKNAYGTDYSRTIIDGSKAVIIPTLFNGAVHSDAASIKQYKQTGQHFGKFDAATEMATKFKASDAYSIKIHERTIVHKSGRPFGAGDYDRN